MPEGEGIAALKLPTLFVFEGGYNVEMLGVNTVNVLEDPEIREGIKRIGRVIGEQVELYEALAPRQSAADASPGTPGREAEDLPVDEAPSNVVPLRKEANG